MDLQKAPLNTVLLQHHLDIALRPSEKRFPIFSSDPLGWAKRDRQPLSLADNSQLTLAGVN